MQPGDILYFEPFYFSDSKTQPPKNKYFLVLGHLQTNMVVSSLPTSQDHVPGHLEKAHGCIKSEPQDGFSCYFFQSGRPVTTCGWGFPLDTFLYGEQIKTFEIGDPRFLIDAVGVKPYKKMGCCTVGEYRAILKCLTSGVNVKNKYKRLFEEILQS